MKLTYPLIRNGAAALLLAIPLVAAMAAYPDRVIKIVVPFPAGGSTDLVARSVAQEMGKALDQTVIVENRAGAGSVIGSEYVARATPDGYTLLFSGATSIYMPYLYKDLAFKPVDDFVGIGLVADIPNLVAVNAKTPYKSVAELVKEAKSKPGEIAYASAGVGTPAHLVCELMAAGTGVKLLHVPYKGNAPAVADLLGGQVPVMCNNLAGTLPFMKGDSRIRILAVTGVKRSLAAPDVPTFAEAGVPGLESGIWQALVAPVATPKAIVATLSNALSKALESPVLRERLAALGAEPLTGTPAAYEARVKKETAIWTPVLKSLDLKPQ
ncbi:MAG: tripartite tricarboxylate transporter substrate binding protein [Variovorax sp.]